MKKLLTLAIVLTLSLAVNAAPPADTTTLTLQVGGGSKFATINVVDQVTGNFVAATVTNVAVQNNNPELATVIPNPTNPTAIKATAVAPGAGSAVVTCHVTYTDPGDGLQKSEDKTIVIAYTVVAAPHGVNLSLNFN